MPVVGEAITQVRAQVADFQKGMKEARQQVAAFGVSAKRSAAELAAAEKWYDRNIAKTANVGKAAVQAASGLDRLQLDIKQASADFRAGIIAPQDYATALRIARQEAIGLRVAGKVSAAQIGQFNNIMTSTARSGAALSRSMTAVRGGLGTVRSSLATLTAMMVGVRGTMGVLISNLLLFSAGNAVALGIIAGIAAIAGAFHLLDRRAREARERIRELIEAGQRLQEQHVDQRLVLRPNLAELRAEQDRLLRQLESAQAGRQVKVGFMRGEPVFETRVDQGEIEKLTDQIRAVQQAILGTSQQIAKLDEDALEPATNQLEAMRAAAARMADTMQKAVESGRNFMATLRDRALALAQPEVEAYRKGLEMLISAFQSGLISAEQFNAGIMNISPSVREARERFEEWIKTIRENMRATFREMERQRRQAQREMMQVYRSMGQALATALFSGLFDGFKSFGGVLKGLLSSALGAAVNIGLGKLFAPAGVAAGLTRGKIGLPFLPDIPLPGLSNASGATLNLTVPPLDGVAVVTDPEWQRLWRDTARQAEAQGFRVRVR